MSREEPHPNPHGPLTSLTVVPLDRNHAKALMESAQQVVLGFVDARTDRPIILGLVQTPATTIAEHPQSALIDDREVVLRGKERIELKCGRASIMLTRAGKVLIRGTHLSSQSSGANRIRGGSVEIN